MGTYIVVIVLIIITAAAVAGSLKHFRGEGGCCGGSGEIRENKKLKGSIVAKKAVYIEGMHCEHCRNAVERQINKIDGAAAKVNLGRKCAYVSMERDVSDEELTAAVARADFKVTEIVRL